MKAVRCASNSSANIRNIGVIAHIDAGKTTVTEQILYLTGCTKHVGNVDQGNTITDFMDLERERGITIQSAAITVFHRDHRINIIDTPGHVDFTVEVERSLRVLDGAVVVLDASAGVQAQTLTVWKQAQKNALPSAFFINKMDKPNADFSRSVDSIRQKLSKPVALVVVPWMKEDNLMGFIDVLDRKVLNMAASQWTPINEKSHEEDVYFRNRQSLLEVVAEYDDQFADLFLSAKDFAQIPTMSIKEALSRASVSSKLSALACGSGLRSTSSVAPVLDIIVDYLPSPDLTASNIPASISTCGLVFKVGHDLRKGKLAYVRVYKGDLKAGQGLHVHNQNAGTLLSTGHSLYIPFSDELRPVAHVDAGNITVVAGLGSAVTGDTLTSAKDRTPDPFLLHGIDYPEPVFFCSIEPPNAGTALKLEKALAELCVEDPSFRVRSDLESGQNVLESMGELHVDVLKYRLQHEYGLDVFLGPMRVNYREMIGNSEEVTATVSDVYDQKKSQHCTLRIRLEPVNDLKPFKKAHIELEDKHAPFIRHEWQNSISEGCKNALFNGPILGFPVQGVKVVVLALDVSGGRINPALLSACASDAVGQALSKAQCFLIEPVMEVEVDLLASDDHQGLTSAVLQELTKRRADILESGRDRVLARLPLGECTDLARSLRSVSSGLASFHMRFVEYSQVPVESQARIQADHT